MLPDTHRRTLSVPRKGAKFSGTAMRLASGYLLEALPGKRTRQGTWPGGRGGGQREGGGRV